MIKCQQIVYENISFSQEMAGWFVKFLQGGVEACNALNIDATL